MPRIIYTLLICFTLTYTIDKPIYAQYSQTKKIVGKVFDAETGDPVIGANVYLENTSHGASTDLEGNFTIQGVREGTYTIIISALSYGKKKIQQFTVNEASVYTLNIQLKPDALKTQEVVVEGTMLLSYEGVLLSQRKKNDKISDVMSAEQIKRAPDVTSGEALRRLTGVSIVDNKFIYIRGITERYNQTNLNGTALASLETDKRSFSFDILPANLLDNIVVVKNATPELRGDFTGGLVQLNTLDFPDKRSLKASIGSSYNTTSTFQSVLRSESGSLDWLGIDNGKRQLPNQEFIGTDIARRLPNNWNPNSKQAPLNLSFVITYGDVFSIDDDSQIGFVGAVTYRNNYQKNLRELSDISLGRSNKGERNNYSVLWGALANMSAKLNNIHKISLKNTYNHSGEDQVSQYIGQDFNNFSDNRYTILQWSQRYVYNGQLIGEHYFESLGGTKIDWKIYTSLSNKEVPDRKEVTYYRELGIEEIPFSVAVNKRSWNYLKDKNFGGSLDFIYPITNIKVKFGGMIENRATSYRIRYFDVIPDYFGGIPSYLTQLPLSEIYAPENYGNGKYLFKEVSNPSDRYEGEQHLSAVYGMIDYPLEIGDNPLRIVGGLRFEQSQIEVRIPLSLEVNSPIDKNSLKDTDVLPSANITYTLYSAINFRAAYSQTVNRPEFREMARTGFYDFIRYEIVGGNPNIKTAKSNNYDVRIEAFPMPGELVALSYFHKRISNAIEEQLMFTATRTRTWINSPVALNTGWELEMRKNLGFISNYLTESSINLNFTRVFSAVEFSTVEGNSQATTVIKAKRPMYGQSPFIINASLILSEPSMGTSLNIFYNKYGRRIDAVGFLAADIYEEARESVELTLSQLLTNNLEVKLSAKNLNGKDKIYTRAGMPYERINIGKTYSIQVSQTF